MLGWDGSAAVSGGLGVASTGLARALERLGLEVELTSPERTVRAEHRPAPIPRRIGRYWPGELLSGMGPGVGEGEGERTTSGALLAHAVPELRAYDDSAALGDAVRRFARAVGRLAADGGHDLVHAHDWTTFPAALVAREVAGLPVVLHVHATERDRRPTSPDPRIVEIERAAIRASDRTLCVSEYTARQVRRLYGVDAELLRIIHNGVDPPPAAALPAGRPFAGPCVLFLARVTEQKDPETFLGAAARVVAVRPDVHFVVAGEGDRWPATVERAAALGLARHVHFAGHVSGTQRERAFALADVLCLPSVSEPFGLVALEAESRGVPVVASSTCGALEVLPSARSFPAGDAEALSRELLRALASEPAGTRLRRRGAAELGPARARGPRGLPGARRVTAVVFYFQVHQPYRLLPRGVLDVGTGRPLFDDGLNEAIARRVADRCYLPMNRVLLDAIERTDGAFRCAFSLSGTVISQLEAWAPEALESFAELAATGAVELICETSHHSLAAVADPAEFAAQVEAQAARIEELGGRRPRTFRDTELIFDDDIARAVEELGFDLLLVEGAEGLMRGRGSAHVYRAHGCERLRLLPRSFVLSDDIAFRFSNREWSGYPLMADTFAEWLADTDPADEVLGLFMDYETFGEHQDASTGILDFMAALPDYALEQSRLRFATPEEVLRELDPIGTLSAPSPVSWADAERDLSAWLANPMQRAAHEALYELLPRVRRAADPELTETWRRLSTSDHPYYMSTKHLSDGDVHEYFSPYGTPHDAFVNFMNALEDFAATLPDPAP